MNGDMIEGMSDRRPCGTESIDPCCAEMRAILEGVSNTTQVYAPAIKGRGILESLEAGDCLVNSPIRYCPWCGSEIQWIGFEQ